MNIPRKYFLGILCACLGAMCIEAYAQDCFDATISSPTPFMGNSGEIFKLSDGTIGEVGAEYEYLYEYYPSVTVCPDRSILILKGKSLSISILSTPSPAQGSVQDLDSTPSLIESKVDDEFEGYDYGNIYRLRNGQIWEQTSTRYRHRYKYAPDVIIFRRNGSYQMQVEDMDDSVTVERIT